MKRIIIGLILFTLISHSCKESKKNEMEETTDKQILTNWKLESTTQVTDKEKAVSSKDFNDKNWIDAQLPTTVLRALVKAEVYPDPHFDMNNFKIPDANDEMNKRFELEGFTHLKGIPNPFKDPYWFRTEFMIPKSKQGKKTWLNFDGINYRADVWLNGTKIADHNDIVGMFTRFKFDISDQVKKEGENVLAVKIHQVDHLHYYPQILTAHLNEIP